MSLKQTNTATPGCGDFDPNSLNWEVAQQLILESIVPITTSEQVALRDALGRVLGADIHSKVNVPNHRNSAMDGFAFRGDDLGDDGHAALTVTGESLAGKPYAGQVRVGECVRIMTGAVMPEQTDSVIMLEHTEQVEVDGSAQIRFVESAKAGQNVRQAGEDIKKGDIVLATGRRLTAADLGLMASLGIGELAVFRKPRVAFFSNGDELRSIGGTLEIGDVFDSNRYTLHAMLRQLGAELIDLGLIADDPAALRDAFIAGDQIADMVITSAGASVGDADYVHEILDSLGSVSFWKLAIKPGRPLAFGQLDSSVFFGLPGNPVAVMVTFGMFVSQALRQLAGETEFQALTLQARCESSLKKRPGRAEFQRAVVSSNNAGTLSVTLTGAQGSGLLNSMSRANCFIVLPDESEGIEIGDTVIVYPFTSLY